LIKQSENFHLPGHEPPTFIGVLGSFFAIHPLFLLFDALKPPHPFLFLRAPAYRLRVSFRYPSSFSLFVFQSNSDPPNHQRLGAVHLFVTPRSLLLSCEPDPCLADRPCFILRTLESSPYPFLFSQPFVYKAPCHDYPHANNSTKLEIF
jgi:hypothetical protein